MEENQNTLTIVDENGNETLCEILFTYHSDKFNKNYVVFIVPGDEESEDQEVGAASYIETEGQVGELSAIDTDEEWAEVEEMLNAFVEDECDCDCDECNCEECGEDHECSCGHCHHEK